MEENNQRTDVTLNRNRGIGGSDISSIMGYKEAFTKRFDLLQYKAGIKEPTFTGNQYTDYGNVLEPKIRDYINKEYGYNFKTDYVEECDPILDRYYHADGVDHNEKVVLEIKTTSHVHDKVEDYEYYLVQLLDGMDLWRYENGLLAVYERPNDFDTDFDPSRLQVFSVGMEDYERLVKEIHCEITKFRTDYSYLVENPGIEEYMLPSNSALRKISTAKMKIGGINIPVSWLLENISEIKKAESDIRDKLKSQMEEHSIKKVAFTDLGIKFTYVPATEGSTKMKFNEKKFKKENEKLYEQYLEETTSGARSASVRLTKMAKGEKA